MVGAEPRRPASEMIPTIANEKTIPNIEAKTN